MDFNHLVFFSLAVYIYCIPSIFFLNLVPVYVCRCVWMFVWSYVWRSGNSLRWGGSVHALFETGLLLTTAYTRLSTQLIGVYVYIGQRHLMEVCPQQTWQHTPLSIKSSPKPSPKLFSTYFIVLIRCPILRFWAMYSPEELQMQHDMNCRLIKTFCNFSFSFLQFLSL